MYIRQIILPLLSCQGTLPRLVNSPPAGLAAPSRQLAKQDRGICGPKDSPSTWGGAQPTERSGALGGQRTGTDWTLVGLPEAGESHRACYPVVSRDHPRTGPSGHLSLVLPAALWVSPKDF